MARFTRIQVLTKMEETGLVPVFYNPDIDVSKNIVEACARGGAVCLEMVNRGDRAIEVFQALELFCREEYPDVILGTGSIIDAPTAALYISYGSNFIVGPVLDRETALLCNKRKIPYSPGCGSATEIHQAHELGVEICKIFPGGQVGGPAFVKSMKGPCPWASIMPTGGVSPTRESLTEWFEAGITCAGMGSKLVTKDLVKNGDFDGIKKNIAEALSLIKEIRDK
ncbi:bifunctional 4-hydroxy-2-oxoglutarate aldolase/2-dehydro-3-deoxy-phosphogluconate aldolase [Fibrobacterota bacterium]